MKLQKKFFTFFLAYLLIALILIFAVRLYSTNIVKEQIANNLVNTVLSKKQLIESVLDEYRELVKQASNEIDYNAIIGEELNDKQKKELINQWIKSTIESRSDIYQIRILNKSGIIIASNHEDVGEDKSTNDIFLKGKRITLDSPVIAIKKNMSFIPEDRKVAGLFLMDSARNNIISSVLKRVSILNFLSNGKIVKMVIHFIDLLRVKVSNIDQNVTYLSGGNQQKILVSKCLACEPEVVIAVDPTRGIDVGSKVDIHEILREQTRKGVGVILVSSELDEVINMSDKILIFVNGKITKTVYSKDFDNQKISLAINQGINDKEKSNGKE